MSILATAIQARNVQNNIGTLQNQIDRLQGQISSGKKSNVFSGYNVDSRRMLEFQSSITTYSRYEVNIQQTNMFLDAQVTALNQIEDIGSAVVSRITSQLDGSLPDSTIINNTTQTDLNNVLNLVNTRFQGRYIFAGRGTNDQNVAAGQNAPPVFGIDPVTPGYRGPPATNNFFQLLRDPTYGVVNIGSASGGITPAEAQTRLDHIFDSRLAAGTGGAIPSAGTNPYPQATWFNGDLGSATVGVTQESILRAELSDNITVDYNKLVLDPDQSDPLGAGPATSSTGFEDVIKALSVLGAVGLVNSGVSVNATDEQDYITVLQNAVDLLNTGLGKLRKDVADLGEKQNFVTQTLTRNQQIEDFTTITLSRIEDVDVAKASTDLFQRKSQLEASYSIISELRNLQLSNFL